MVADAQDGPHSFANISRQNTTNYSTKVKQTLGYATSDPEQAGILDGSNVKLKSLTSIKKDFSHECDSLNKVELETFKNYWDRKLDYQRSNPPGLYASSDPEQATVLAIPKKEPAVFHYTAAEVDSACDILRQSLNTQISAPDTSKIETIQDTPVYYGWDVRQGDFVPEYSKGVDNAPYITDSQQKNIDLLNEKIAKLEKKSKPLIMDTGVTETDPSGKSPNTPGAKLDAGKNRPWLFFKGYARALKAVSEVTTAGAKKYTPNGWKTVENGEDRYMDAFMRHLIDVALDKKYDDGEGGIGTLHMAQVIWNLLSVLELQLEKEEQTNE